MSVRVVARLGVAAKGTFRLDESPAVPFVSIQPVQLFVLLHAVLRGRAVVERDRGRLRLLRFGLLSLLLLRIMCRRMSRLMSGFTLEDRTDTKDVNLMPKTATVTVLLSPICARSVPWASLSSNVKIFSKSVKPFG